MPPKPRSAQKPAKRPDTALSWSQATASDQSAPPPKKHTAAATCTTTTASTSSKLASGSPPPLVQPSSSTKGRSQPSTPAKGSNHLVDCTTSSSTRRRKKGAVSAAPAAMGASKVPKGAKACDDLYTNAGGLGLGDAERGFREVHHGHQHHGPHKDPWEERWNMALLVLLYMMQGVPLGLTLGSMPFMLQSKLSYSQVAVFSMAAYPYSLKLLWSPLVDSLYFKSIGRRKSWIIPVQLLTAWMMIAYAGRIEAMIEAADVEALTAHVFVLVFMAATQDIAVDGWALTLLSEEHVGYASTCQTVGTTTGFFTSFTVFLALNSADFCNAYIRCWPQLVSVFGIEGPGASVGVLTLPGYLKFWGWVFLIVTAAIAFGKREDPEVKDETDVVEKEGTVSVWKEIVSAYSQLFGVMRLPAVWWLTSFLLTYRLGVIAAEGAYSLKLIDKGVGKEAISFLVLFQFPVELASAFLAGRWASNHSPYPPLICGYFIRLLACLAAVFLVAWFPAGASSFSEYPIPFLALATVNLFLSFAGALSFTAIGSFFNKISDPLMGGSYLTMLNTLANIGYIAPKAPLFFLMDYLTVPMCSSSDGFPLLPDSLAATCPKKLMAAAEGNACTKAGGTCALRSDGFYIIGYCSLVLGACLGVAYMRILPKLIGMPLNSWRVAPAKERTE